MMKKGFLFFCLATIFGAVGFVGQANADALTVNAQTGTTYTFVNSDCGKLVTFTNAAAIAATLPAASGPSGTGGNSGFFMPPCSISVANYGAGTLTITTSTSTFQPSAVATAVLTQRKAFQMVSDGTNWVTSFGITSWTSP
jgi:hypothetical protein